jgi:hypothetical protein
VSDYSPRHEPVADEITFGGPTRLDLPALKGYPAVRRRRRARFVVALSAVLVVAVAGGAFAAVRAWYGWGTTQPEQVIPGDSVAFVRVDLSPGLGQRLAIDRLAKKFPDTGKSTEDFVARVEQEIVKGIGLIRLDYDRDIKPWFADRIGAALWTRPGDGQSCELVALASRDEAKARAALTAAAAQAGDGRMGFGFLDGYAVIAECGGGDSQAAADAAVRAATHESLTNHRAFRDAVGALPGAQTVLGYADIAALLPALRMTDFAMLVPGVVDPSRGGAPPSSTGPSGVVVFGARATDDGVDIRFRATGLPGPGKGRNVLADLGQLPANTKVGIAADLSVQHDALTALQKQMASVLKDSATLGGLPVMPGADAQDLGAPGGVSPLGKLMDGMLDPGDVDAAADALFRSVLTVSVTELGDAPGVRVTARAPDEASARTISSAVSRLATNATARLSVAQVGDTVTVTTADFTGSGALAGESRYRQALAGAPGTTVMAAFVDVTATASAARMPADERDRLAPVKAIGFAGGYDGDAAVGMLRIVIS